MNFFKTKYLQTHDLILKKEFSDINIDDLLDMQHDQFSSRIERWTYEGSGWILNLVIQHQLVISEITPCEGIFYFQLPKKLRKPKKGLINTQKRR